MSKHEHILRTLRVKEERKETSQLSREENSMEIILLDIFVPGATRGLTWVQACPQTPASSCPLLLHSMSMFN